MPTSLAFDEHLAALEIAGARLLDLAGDAGLDASVPTCPTWDVRALLAHQTMVHRWATAQIRGDDADLVPNQTTIRDTVADLPGFFAEGHRVLIDALCAAPADLAAMTFLADAPPPREFWARRQAHETTIHMVDGLAATLGRAPVAAEAGIAAALATDGLDELLRGFFTRGRSKLYEGTEYTIAVVPSDVTRRWILHVGPALMVEPGDPRVDDPRVGDGVAATLSGTAAELYLALWNRGEEATVSGRADILGIWRANQRVRWG